MGTQTKPVYPRGTKGALQERRCSIHFENNQSFAEGKPQMPDGTETHKLLMVL
jgi:transcriptional regulator GlxA family with amidase domain